MIQHIKKKRKLFIYLLICLFVFNSCNLKKDSKKNKKIEIISELKKQGEWKLVKSAKYGTWEEGIEYTYNQEQLKKKYVKTIISFSKEYIVIENEPYCSGSNIVVTEPLDLNLNGTDDDREKVKLFFKKEFILSEVDFKGIYKTTCETPFHTIFDFGDKLLVREWGVYYYLFEKKEEIKQDALNSKGYNCKEVEIKTNIYEEPLYNICDCDFDFSKCYTIFYNESDDYYKKLMLSNLPKKDTIIFFDSVETKYKFYKKDSLNIRIIQDGGESEYWFKNVEKKTKIECYTYPL